MTLILIVAGIVAGLVNYFYIYLNLPLEKKKTSEQRLIEEDEVQWEIPKLTFWLALLGYFIIGFAGASLTPLINAILDHLKGLNNPIDLKTTNDKWILFGYGIVFGFSTNRLLSSISESILARIEAILKAKEGQKFRQPKISREENLFVDRARLTLDQVRVLISGNNNSEFSPELIVSICWAESSFDPSATASSSSSKGLMMMNNQAIDTVNANTPTGIHFEYNDMFSADKAISCGTWYLKTLYTKPDWGSQGDKRKTLRAYRGVGDYTYADKLIACESCMQSSADQQACLNNIHT